jgi:hypothetical protein
MKLLQRLPGSLSGSNPHNGTQRSCPRPDEASEFLARAVTDLGRIIVADAGALRAKPRPAVPARFDRSDRNTGRGGDYEGALIGLLTDVVGLPEEQIAGMRTAADWPERVAYAPAVVAEVLRDWLK